MSPVFFTLCELYQIPSLSEPLESDLHAFVTENVINDEIMNVFENSEKVQREGLFLRKRSFSNSSQDDLPKYDTFVDIKPNTASYTIIPKVLAVA